MQTEAIITELKTLNYRVAKENNYYVPYYGEEKLDNGFIEENFMWEQCYRHHLQQTGYQKSQVEAALKAGYEVGPYVQITTTGREGHDWQCIRKANDNNKYTKKIYSWECNDCKQIRVRIIDEHSPAEGKCKKAPGKPLNTSYHTYRPGKDYRPFGRNQNGWNSRKEAYAAIIAHQTFNE